MYLSHQHVLNADGKGMQQINFATDLVTKTIGAGMIQSSANLYLKIIKNNYFRNRTCNNKTA